MSGSDPDSEDGGSGEESKDPLFESVNVELARLMLDDRPPAQDHADQFDFNGRDYAILVSARSLVCASVDAQSPGALDAIRSVFGPVVPDGVSMSHSGWSQMVQLSLPGGECAP